MTLFSLGAVWLAGIALGQALRLSLWQWAALAAGALASALAFRRRERLLLGGLTVLFLAAARLTLALPRPDPLAISAYNDTGIAVRVTGVLIAPPDVRGANADLRLRAERVAVPGQTDESTVRGIVLVRADGLTDWAYGDRLQVWGVLETPPTYADFSYRDYLARSGVFSLMNHASVTRLARRQANPVMQVIYDLRGRALATVHRLFPDPEASLLAGILLGSEGGIADEVRQAFNTTGTAHIIAISGFNIAIIASALTSLFGRLLGKRRGMLAACLAIAIYTILVGADASVVRAAIMAGLAFMALRLGRQGDALASLAAAGVVMTLVNPWTLWDVGFQLSFAATLGLVLYAEPLRDGFIRLASRWISDKRAATLAGPVGEFVLFTLAAQVTTLPLTALYFQRLTPVSAIANPAILPAQPAVMILGGLATLAGTIWLPLGRPLAWLAWPFVAYTIRLVEFFARWPLASLDLGQVAPAAALAFYGVLFGLTAYFRLPPDRRPRLRVPMPDLSPGLALLGLAVATGLIWRVAADSPDGLLRLTALDVGRGEAILIRSATGRFVLVGGGSDPVSLSDSLGRRLPLLGAEIDWVVAASAQEDHVAGLAADLTRLRVRSALVAGTQGSSAYRALLDGLTQAGVPVSIAVPGHALDLGGGGRLEVLAVGQHGAVLLVTQGLARFLLAPGADPELAAMLAGEQIPGPVTAVLLADGGFAAVNPAVWLEQMRPLAALISVEAADPRGRPSPEVLQVLAGTTVLRTDRNGWIELATDGERVWASAERAADD